MIKPCFDEENIVDFWWEENKRLTWLIGAFVRAFSLVFVRARSWRFGAEECQF